MNFAGNDPNWHGPAELNRLHVREIQAAQDGFVVNLCAGASQVLGL